MTNFGWSYPPGVTGNELQIAGPTEWVEQKECSECGAIVRADMAGHPDEGVWWECPACGASHEEDWQYPEPDPDEAYDRWREERDERFWND